MIFYLHFYANCNSAILCLLSELFPDVDGVDDSFGSCRLLIILVGMLATAAELITIAEIMEVFCVAHGMRVVFFSDVCFNICGNVCNGVCGDRLKCLQRRSRRYFAEVAEVVNSIQRGTSVD